MADTLNSAAGARAAIPARPERVHVRPMDGAALVSWERPSAGIPATTYDLTPVYGGIPLPERTVTVDGSSSSGVVKELLNGVSYTVRITPWSGEVPGPSAQSTAFRPNPAPAAPAVVSAYGGEQSATVRWAHSAGGGPVDGYRVIATPEHVPERTVPSSQNSLLVVGLHNRVRYTFTVVAGNGAGESVSAPSNPVWPGDDIPWYMFPLELTYLVVLGAVAYLYAVHSGSATLTLPFVGQVVILPLREAVPPTVAGVPVSVPWFGALGAVLIGLYGIFDHGHNDWERRYNAWHIARPLTGSVLGAVAFILFIGVVRATGLNLLSTDPLGKLIYFAIAFVVGFREQAFRQLIGKAGDMILGPGSVLLRTSPSPAPQPAPAVPRSATAAVGPEIEPEGR